MNDLLAQLLTWPDVSHRRMMGADCFLVSARMFIFFPSADTAVLKLPEPHRERLLALPGAGPFTMPRGVFGAWVQAPLASLDGESLLDFAHTAAEYVRSLPPPKPRKRRRGAAP